jgi:predicted alpha/beta superfamily hydrolase
MPYIETNYPVAPNRTLIGYSFGGLFVMNTLINHTDMFNAYVAVDPSLWWDDQKLMKQGATALS